MALTAIHDARSHVSNYGMTGRVLLTSSLAILT
jgi:hypothetical protein